ncbi:MAG TPA: methyltransferase domain-containing protein [Steroidobacteraceae bacterium]
MMKATLNPNQDEWSKWVLHDRSGGDPGYEAVVRRAVERIADRVLDEAQLFSGMRLVDVGAGDGLLAFRALERLGTIQVVLTDISQPLLRHAEDTAAHRNFKDHCTFLECSAEKLTELADSTVDAIVSRSSIAYVADKNAAFREFQRVLKPGGRISLAEPIMQEEAFAARALKARVEAQSSGSPDQFLTLLHRWKAAQFPDTAEGCAKHPLVNFSERDLINMVRAAGFVDIHMQLHIDVAPSLITSWEIFLASSPHPWAPSLGAILETRFSAEERHLFEALVKPTVESGKNVAIDRMAYLNAKKPALHAIL